MIMKRTILEMLRDAGEDYISGEDIGNKLNISRTAVWKHVQSLRKSGYNISSSERRGYRLENVPDLLTPEIVQFGLNTKITGNGNRMVHVLSTDSTNRLAKVLAYRGAEDGTVVVAEEQTGGKGRMDREFFSPKEKGIWFSVILRPQCLPKDAPKFTLMAAVAVAMAMERFDLRAEIKWPNDIVYDGRKIVGILTEMSAEVSRVRYVIVGIGINVNIEREEFPESIREVAASLSEMKDESVSRAEFFRAVLEEFDKLYNPVKVDFDEIFKLWRKYNITLGKTVNVISAGSGDTFVGVATEIDADGALIVNTRDGWKTVYAGDVSIRDSK